MRYSRVAGFDRARVLRHIMVDEQGDLKPKLRLTDDRTLQALDVWNVYVVGAFVL